MQLTKHWAGTLDDYVIDLAWSPDGTLLAAASAAGPVYLFSAADGTLRHQLPGHEGGTNCLAWQVFQTSEARSQMSEGRGQRSEASSQTSEVRGQMPEGTEQKSEISGQMSEVGEQTSEAELKTQNPELKTQPTPESRNAKPETSLLLATGGQDGAVKFWDATAGQHTATAKLGGTWVEHLAWRPVKRSEVRGQGAEISGQRSEVRGQGAEIRGQGAEVGGQGAEVGTKSEEEGHRSDVRSETAAVTGGTAAGARVSDIRHPASGLLFAAAGRTLAALRPDASVVHTFKPAPKTISALAMQPGGGAVAAAYFGGVVLWDTDDFVAQKELPYANGIHALVWSPDDKWLVSGNQDPSVHLWIPEEDVELHMSGYEGKVKYLSFDQTSRWLATSGGREGCVWDCAGAGPEGREPAMLPHESPVCAVKFQNAHGLLATASVDGVVHLWSPERRQPLRATVRMPTPATRLAWSPDDQYLAIGSEKGVVYVLKCVP